jgi:crotonobetainyl-CoA:carnitine CoA-transferase CaiB-like acyl-CoA transferase
MCLAPFGGEYARLTLRLRRQAQSLILDAYSGRHDMSDWEERLKAAEASAEHMQAAEEAAEERFRARQAAEPENPQAALESEEFHSWMATRRATDGAWGQWAMLMDSKPHG